MTTMTMLQRIALQARAGAPQRRWYARQPKRELESNVAGLRGTPHLKRKLGQHLLVSDEVLDATVAAAALPELLAAKRQASGDANATLRVLEIGPGTGNLTSALLRSSPHVRVHAVEYDARMVSQLTARFSSEIQGDHPRLAVENADFEQFSFPQGDAGDVIDACVANIPYQLSSLVVARLAAAMHRSSSTDGGRLQRAVLLVQDEFAQRLLAAPGSQSYSRLSVNTALVADVASVCPVPRALFVPPPKVDSRVVSLSPRAAPSALLAQFDDPLVLQRFDALLRLCFQRKNKTLRALLTARAARNEFELDAAVLTGHQDDKEAVTTAVEDALAACDLDGKRAVQVSVDQFLQLLRALSDRGIALRPSATRHFRD